MQLTEEKKRECMKRLLFARMNLLAKNGFFGLLLMKMKFALDENCETAQTDGTVITFGTSFLDELSDKELRFILMHEVMHVALLHCFRGNDRDAFVFNIACDIVVNSNILLSCDNDITSISLSKYGVSMHLTPDGEEGYKYTAEEVYEMLKQAINSKSFAGGNGLWDDHSKWGKASDDGFLCDEVKKNVIESVKVANAMKGNGAGKVPLCIERVVDTLTKPKLDWRTILDDFVQEEVADYSFSPPDKRYGDNGFFLPDYNDSDINIKNILFMIDTSGSISDKMVTEFYSEIKGAIEQFNGKLSGKLGFFDANVVEPVPFDSVSDILSIKPIGGGGTNFINVFKYIKEYMSDDLPASIIILTDGYDKFPDESMSMGIPVLWAISGSHVDPPWGRKIELDRF